jgi:cellulose synthase/poly-beta-1,6-N-acetylglucosamine synthase-like glycosyltransferase
VREIGSARTPQAWWQLAVLPTCLMIPPLLLWRGGADGLMLCGLVLATAMAATVSLRLAAVLAGLVARRRDGAASLAEDSPDLPRYTVLVPLYHEAAVVPHLLTALAALRWPRDRFEALLLVEEDDAETRAALASLPDGVRMVMVPDGRPRTKPRACNHGLALATGELLVVFDAEDRPEPDQLLRAAAAFRALPTATACLQARLQADHRGHGAPALGFAVDYATWFDLYLPGLHAVGAPIPLGGTSNHFRTAALRAVGGWDAWNVTEDADLGVRLARNGLATAVIDSTTWEEAPSRWGPWLRQRSRWMKGWWQTALVHTRHPLDLVRDLGAWRAAWWLATIPGQVLAALAAPGCWLLLAVGWWRGWPLADAARPWTASLLVAATALLLVNLLFIALTALAAWRRGRIAGALLAPLLPLYWLAVSLAAWRGVLQFHSDPFKWEKTPHGQPAPNGQRPTASAQRPAASGRRSLPGEGLCASATGCTTPVSRRCDIRPSPEDPHLAADSDAVRGQPPAPPRRWWRPAIAMILVLGLAGIAAAAWTAPRWSGFSTDVARRSIDPRGAPSAEAVLAPDADWLPRARLAATLRLAAPAPHDLPLRLTFNLAVLDGTWFQHDAETVIPAGAESANVAIPLRGDGWSDPLGTAVWDEAWLRRVRSAGVRAWLPRDSDAQLSAGLSPDDAVASVPLTISPAPMPDGIAVRRMAELRFRLSRAYDNPFDPARIEAWAEIRAPDGSVRRAEAFAMQDYRRRMADGTELLDPLGAPGWAVRFTPATPGEHLVTLHARDHTGDTAEAGPLPCSAAPGDGPGFVRSEGRWFAREDGSFLYPVPLNLRSPSDRLLDGTVPMPEYRSGTEVYGPWLERCGAAGINLVRPWLAPGFLGLEWNRGWRGYHGLGQYNLENAWRVDRLLSVAARNHVLIELALWQHGPWARPGESDSQWLDSPYRREAGGPLDDPRQAVLDPQVRRLHLQQARYAAARWGADPTLFGWTLWIEVDAIAGRNPTAPWHAELAAELAARSWGRQGVSAEFRSGTGDPAVWSLPGITYTQLAGYSSDPMPADPDPGPLDVFPKRERTLAHWSKPAFIEEYGGSPAGSSPRRLALEIHDGLWGAWGMDFAGAPMPWWWNLVLHHGLERWHRRFTAYIAGADLRGVAWKTGERRLPSGARAFVRIGPDRAWAWLRPRGAPPAAFDPLAVDPGTWFTADASRTIDLQPLGLAAGRWRVEVWDTWSDTAPLVCEIDVADGPVILPLPTAVRDVALRLERR